VKKTPAFTLVELMIVIAILGIIAALVVPNMRSYTEQAKEAAAKRSLQIFRSTIERYAAEHNGVPPGYPNDDPTRTPSSNFLRMQLCTNSAYFKKIPENPFNELNSVRIVGGSSVLAAEASDDTGWIYKPGRKAIKLNSAGTDSEGVPYSDY